MKLKIAQTFLIITAFIVPSILFLTKCQLILISLRDPNLVRFCNPQYSIIRSNYFFIHVFKKKIHLNIIFFSITKCWFCKKCKQQNIFHSFIIKLIILQCYQRKNEINIFVLLSFSLFIVSSRRCFCVSLNNANLQKL